MNRDAYPTLTMGQRRNGTKMIKRFKSLVGWVLGKRGWICFFLAVFLTAALVGGKVPFLSSGSAADQNNVHFVELTAENFQSEMSKAKGPIFVEIGDGTADSRATQVTLDEAAKNYAGKVTFFRVNATENPEVAQQFVGVVARFVQSQGMQMPPDGLPMPLHLLFQFNDKGQPQVMNLGVGHLLVEEAQMWIDMGLSGEALQPRPQPTAPATPNGAAPTPTPVTPGETEGK
jgi:hypothetical protein